MPCIDISWKYNVSSYKYNLYVYLYIYVCVVKNCILHFGQLLCAKSYFRKTILFIPRLTSIYFFSYISNMVLLNANDDTWGTMPGCIKYSAVE